MAKKRKKMTLEPGKKYKGTGWINEYGQQFFEASQSEPNENNMKMVIKEGVITLYESKNCLKVACKLDKTSDKIALIKEFTQALTKACKIIKDYDFSD